jgi:DNA polymerase-4
MRYILHADMDAFYASVEQLDHPAFRGLPLVVGGSPASRGVVAAASYEARKYGIRSAMPMVTAIRLYSNIIRVPPRFTRYREVSNQVMSLFRELTHLVEPLSLDEAYLDISKEVFNESALEGIGSQLKLSVREHTGLAITVGGGTSKTVAKIASQMAKPDGLLLIKSGQERSFLNPLNVGILWGVGPKTESVLKQHGIDKIGDLAERDSEWVLRVLGKRGMELQSRALGEDLSEVSTSRETKSVSVETTLSEDIIDPAVLKSELKKLSDKLSTRVRKNGLMFKTISLKLRLSDFTTFTRQHTLTYITEDTGIIFQISMDLLEKEMKPGLEFRLLGIGVSGFRETGQLVLFTTEDTEIH